MLRGIYAEEDEASPEWRTVPVFDAQEQCKEFMSRAKCCTNPAYPLCDQIFTTLCDWDQVERLLLRQMERYRLKYGFRSLAEPWPLREGNVFVAARGVAAAMDRRLSAPHHATASAESTLNTARYLFFHMRCGIFVMFRRGKLVMFVPFVNKDYRNTWSKYLTFDGAASVAEYYERKRLVVRVDEWEHVLEDTSQWWANGNIIDNWKMDGVFWGDAYLAALKHMLQTLCARRVVPDCEFFLNKRDFPQLRADLSEPYDFMFPSRPGGEPWPLAHERYVTYTPIVSFFVSSAFSDLPFPNTDDWETATGKVFPPMGKELRSKTKRTEVPWHERKATALFRGTATGGGTGPTENQRLALAKLSAEWARDERYNEDARAHRDAYLDAGVTAWNFRDKKLRDRPLCFVDPASLRREHGIQLVPRVEMYDQVRYKYLVYVEGHCAAARYASLLALGSLIIRVTSATAASELWFFPLLVPYDRSKPWDSPENEHADHIAVAADLSDMADVISWCRANDGVCEHIVENAKLLADTFLSEAGILDYLELLLCKIASRFLPTASEAAAAAEAVPATPGDGRLLDGFTVVRLGDLDDGVDWFSPCNLKYARVGLPAADVPCFEPNASCECDHCTMVRASSASALSVAREAARVSTEQPSVQPRKVAVTSSQGRPKRPRIDLSAGRPFDPSSASARKALAARQRK